MCKHISVFFVVDRVGQV